MTSKYRDWCITLNNYSQQNLENLFERLIYSDGQYVSGPPIVFCGKNVGLYDGTRYNVNYLVAGLEVGASGTHHIQAYIEFKNLHNLDTDKMTDIKRVIGETAHLESRKGTPEDASNYCKKGEQSHEEWQLLKEKGPNFGKNANFREYGKRKDGTPGKRTDLILIKDEILNGKTVESIMLATPMLYHQYGRTFNAIEDVAMRKKFRNFETKGLWLHGPTNTSKSHKALENYSPETHYLWPNDGEWWDDYRQQETVVLNDFRGEIPYNNLLNLVDKWPAFVRRRGRAPMPFMSKLVIVTSSLSPDEVYWRREEADKIEQFNRRFEVIELTPARKFLTLDVIREEIAANNTAQKALIEGPEPAGAFGSEDRNRGAGGNTTTYNNNNISCSPAPITNRSAKPRSGRKERLPAALSLEPVLTQAHLNQIELDRKIFLEGLQK